eukprot:augustus_masked-scaffold_1-processed-gene-15.4-mRNA-1 protein AED:0.03 eAED:0.03 QI:0/-1/0/1/-1/1/1/0/344
MSQIFNTSTAENGTSLFKHNTFIEENDPSIHNFALIADLDRQSFSASEKKWHSVLQFGRLRVSKTKKQYDVTVEFGEKFKLESSLSEAGRGMELSELVWYNGKLLSFDDRSGTVFEILKNEDGLSYHVVPIQILTAGNGKVNKGQKTEWASEKDGELFVGSFGKEYVNKDGSVAHRNNLWVNVLGECGDLRTRHEDWTEKYELLREATNTKFPGYMIHEAIMFNKRNRKWYVLPRRVSTDSYDEKKDELMGSNQMIVVNEDFSKVEKVIQVGVKVPERGFSSFKFLRFEGKEFIVALKTVEKEDKETGQGMQMTFITVFDEDAIVYLEDTLIPGDFKFEGVEFV